MNPNHKPKPDRNPQSSATLAASRALTRILMINLNQRLRKFTTTRVSLRPATAFDYSVGLQLGAAATLCPLIFHLKSSWGLLKPPFPRLYDTRARMSLHP